MNKKKQQYKKPVAIGMAAALVICLLGVVYYTLGDDISGIIADSNKSERSETTPVQYVYDADGYHRPSFYDPDWETDIFTLERYLDKNRYITFKEGGFSVMIVDEAYSEYGDTVQFLADYLNTLIYGDAEGLNGFYSSEWLDANGCYESFTMQKLYDMVIEFIVSTDAVNSDGRHVTEYVYKLSYKILENDGTFRSDIESDASRPQFFTVVDDGETFSITSVSYTLQ